MLPLNVVLVDHFERGEFHNAHRSYSQFLIPFLTTKRNIEAPHELNIVIIKPRIVLLYDFLSNIILDPIINNCVSFLNLGFLLFPFLLKFGRESISHFPEPFLRMTMGTLLLRTGFYFWFDSGPGSIFRYFWLREILFHLDYFSFYFSIFGILHKGRKAIESSQKTQILNSYQSV